MYNLLMLKPDDEGKNYWESNVSRWVRALPKSWGVTRRSGERRMPERECWDELRHYPCLFTYEPERTLVVGHIGKIVDTRFPDIKYRLDDRIEFSRDCLRDLGIEYERTEWTVIEDIDLWEVRCNQLRQELYARPFPTEEERMRIWGDDYLRKPRVFLSHRASYKSAVSQVREHLEDAGCVCFVAHEDIQPTTMWRNEIIRALDTMDVFVGFVTDDFHTGGWPDQEVGFAYQRGVPRVFLKMGSRADPIGIVSEEQAITATWDNAGERLVQNLRDKKIIPNPRNSFVPSSEAADPNVLPWEKDVNDLPF